MVFGISTSHQKVVLEIDFSGLLFVCVHYDRPFLVFSFLLIVGIHRINDCSYK